MRCYRRLLLAIVILLLSILTSCGGGGGGGGDEQPLSHDSCALIGLTPRIIDGTACQGNSPVVKLVISSSQGQGVCSGAMIAPDKVLTAAHCVLQGDNLDQLVSRNSVSVSSGDENHPLAHSTGIVATPFGADIVEISKNVSNEPDLNSPDFVSELQDQILDLGLRDLAVIQLDHSLSLPTLPIIVSSVPEDGTVISIYGFGLTDPNGAAPADFPYSGQMRITKTGIDNLFSIFDQQGSDTCHGDSGGPAVVVSETGQAAIVGVTSLGFSECTPGETSVFAHTAGRTVDFLRQAAPNANFL